MTIRCPKAPHDSRQGYMHAEDDDTPYSVDGVLYCGRCHSLAHTTSASREAAYAVEEAAWFRWLRDNPQSGAYIAVLVAKNRPFGPDLGATMNSGEVIGVMEDAKQPEYRYAVPPSGGVSEAMTGDGLLKRLDSLRGYERRVNDREIVLTFRAPGDAALFAEALSAWRSGGHP